MEVDGTPREADETAVDAEDARAAFEVLAEIAIVHQLANAEMARQLPGGMHPSHFAVLRHLDRRGDGRTLQEIARAMQAAKPTMTNTVMRLSDRGMIEIRVNAEDGRSKRMFLTEPGRAFVRDATILLAAPLAEIDARLGLRHVAALLPGLRALRATLDAMRD